MIKEIKRVIVLFLITSACLMQFITIAKAASWFAEIESGMAISGYNTVRIPGNTGTEFSLNGDLDIDPSVFYRVKIDKMLSGRDQISMLAAPLSLKANGTLDKNIFFNGVNFPAGGSVKAKYRFDSYRLSYLRIFRQDGPWVLKAGFTAKIRDAAIRLEGNGIYSEKTNIGVVPLIGFHAEYLPNNKLSFLISGDALAAPQGRAEDVLLAIKYMLKDSLSLHAGYRFVEGGADNDEVYNFALVNYATAGISFNWQ